MGAVVLIAAAVTGAALLLGSGSTAPTQRARALDATAALPTRKYSYSSKPFRPLTPAQMQQQSELMSSECGTGHGGKRLASSPTPRVTLSERHGRREVRLYVVQQQVVVCAPTDAIGDPLSNATGLRPGASSIAIAEAASGDNRGRRTTIEYGRAGAEVRGVSFELTGGANVRAAVGGGWFVVWWPSASAPTSARLTTASGSRTVALEGDATPPGANCPRNSSCFTTANSMNGPASFQGAATTQAAGSGATSPAAGAP